MRYVNGPLSTVEWTYGKITKAVSVNPSQDATIREILARQHTTLPPIAETSIALDLAAFHTDVSTNCPPTLTMYFDRYVQFLGNTDDDARDGQKDTVREYAEWYVVEEQGDGQEFNQAFNADWDRRFNRDKGD